MIGTKYRTYRRTVQYASSPVHTKSYQREDEGERSWKDRLRGGLGQSHTHNLLIFTSKHTVHVHLIILITPLHYPLMWGAPTYLQPAFVFMPGRTKISPNGSFSKPKYSRTRCLGFQTLSRECLVQKWLSFAFAI